MPENEFEKKVSSEMQELRFKPSESVWQHVEERIKKKKKRRIFIIIFLLAGLSLLGYWQRSNLFGEQKNDISGTTQKDSPGEKQKEVNSESAKELDNSSTIDQHTETTKKNETENTTGNVVHDKLKGDKSPDDKKDILVSTNEINKPKKNKDENKVKPVSEKTTTGDGTDVSIPIIAANSKKKNKLVDDRSKEIKTDPETKAKPDEVNQADVKPVENKIDSAKAVIGEQEKNATTKTDTLLKAEQAKTPPTPIVKKVPSEKKWKWGLHITPGISSLSDHGLSFQQNTADRNYAVSTPGSGSAAPPGSQKPSDVKAGFAFQAGAFAQRQLSSRTSLSLGLQYGYYSNILHIGNRRDTFTLRFLSANQNANSVYNAGGDTIKYTNHYHFLELPLSFRWQLNKNKAKPFVWSTGFTIGQLITTNAIMYDTAFNGIYHQNKKLLNKTQFSLSTGFSWTIADNKKVQWNLGPVANIHLNTLADNPFDKKGYMFFVGLRTGILFNQKE